MARERWGSRIGIIMAMAGSAIGLGNFLRFPVQAAQYAPGTFMIPYFIAFFLLGLPLMWIEWTIGRMGGAFGHSTSPGMFDLLWKKNHIIKYVGILGIFGPIVIFTYYIYVESWLLAYCFFSLSGKYNDCTSEQALIDFLQGYQGLTANQHFSSLVPAYIFFLITFVLNLGVISLGIQRGIEKTCRYLLPALAVFAVVLVIRVLFLGSPDPTRPEYNVLNGLGFLWNPNWAALKDAKVWLAAAGQIFFTLSVGIGVILTYASYLTQKDDITLSGLTAASANEVAEVILGGSIVIPAAFAFFGPTATSRIAQGGDFDLAFVTMPLVLKGITLGSVFGFLWFILLFFAGITSSISLAQPMIAFLQDEFHLSKSRAVFIFAIITFILTQPCIFFIGKGVINELDFWAGTVALVIFATVETILFSWIFGIDKAWTELHRGSAMKIPRFYRVVIKYITPFFLLAILGFWLLQKPVAMLFNRIDLFSSKGIPFDTTEVLKSWLRQDFIPMLLTKDKSVEHLPYIWGTRIGLIVLFVVLSFSVFFAWRRKASSRSVL
jgi:NSS family neurotransmitter:Na+ symporter